MDITTQLRNALQASNYPNPTITWLASLQGTRQPPPPLQSLIATAKARLLASDLTTPSLLDPAHTPSFPPDISSPNSAERTLATDIHVQIADIENLSRSRWEQVEELEAIERGEGTRGREIIRLPTTAAADEGDDLGDAATQPGGGRASVPAAGARAAAGRNATHRLVLQDCRGQNVYAMELTRIDKIGVGVTAIGEKMVIKRGTRVARGTLLLTPENCVLLGGKIEAWQRPWVEGRLKRLRETVGSEGRSGP